MASSIEHLGCFVALFVVAIFVNTFSNNLLKKCTIYLSSYEKHILATDLSNFSKIIAVMGFCRIMQILAPSARLCDFTPGHTIIPEALIVVIIIVNVTLNGMSI